MQLQWQTPLANLLLFSHVLAPWLFFLATTDLIPQYLHSQMSNFFHLTILYILQMLSSNFCFTHDIFILRTNKIAPTGNEKLEEWHSATKAKVNLSCRQRVKQRLALYHGVLPIYMEFSNDAEETFSRAINCLMVISLYVFFVN